MDTVLLIPLTVYTGSTPATINQLSRWNDDAFSSKLHLNIAEIELCMLKCHYSGLIVLWWHSATGLGGKKWHIHHNSIV